MKKLVLTVLVTACLTGQIDAQIRYGLKAGLNFDKPKDAGMSVESATGWQAGAFAEVILPVVGIGVQPEVLYTVKKSKSNSSSSSISYFEVPINLRYELNLLVLRPYILAGPYFGYAVGFDGRYDKNNIEKTDFGVGFGAGVELFNKLQVGLRYSLGLKDVSVINAVEMKNRTFSLSAGILF